MYAATILKNKWKQDEHAADLPDTPEVVTMKKLELRLSYLEEGEQNLAEGMYIRSHEYRREQERLAEVQNEKEKAQIQLKIEKMIKSAKREHEEYDELKAEMKECETALKQMKKNLALKN